MSLQIRDVTMVPEGDGVDVNRLFPLRGFMNFDPFVLWDHFNIGAGRGFPDHPHRGFEGITYMFNGGMNHKDNLGNDSFVEEGGAQRFTAGSGIVHSEMPADVSDNNGIQLWVNLPKRLKQIDPNYQQVNNADFPVKTFHGGKVKTLIGKDSPLKLKTDVVYQHVFLSKQSSYQFDVPSDMRGIIYIIKGDLSVSSNDHCSENVALGQSLFVEDSITLNIQSQDDSEFILCFGKPHGEPIRQHGPFVD